MRPWPKRWIDLEFDRWILWTAENPAAFSSVEKGIGSGEAALAWELCARHVGSSKGYDVELADGTSVEVKKFPKNGEISQPVIVAGSSSRAVFEPSRNAIESAMRSCLRAHELIECGAWVDIDARADETDTLRAFVRAAESSLNRGVLSLGAVLGATRKNSVGLLQALRVLRSLLARRPALVRRRHSSISYRGIAPEEVCTGLAFSDPERFVRETWTEFSCSRVIRSDVLAIADAQKGYFLLPRSSFDQRLRLHSTVLAGQLQLTVVL